MIVLVRAPGRIWRRLRPAGGRYGEWHWSPDLQVRLQVAGDPQGELIEPAVSPWIGPEYPTGGPGE